MITRIVTRKGLRRRAVQKARILVVAGPDRGVSRVFEGARITLGTDAGCDVVLADPKVSRRHLEIATGDDGYDVTDLGSTNGSFIHDLRFERVTVSRRASIRLGDDEVVLEPLEDAVEIPAVDHTRFGDAIGASPLMREVFAVLERVARSNLPVLVEGETGTGKELLAEGVHRASARASKPFVVFDCGAVADTLLESELFGHEKGAFTGAVASRAGVFEQADKGTLFIDEIGELPLALQPKLLRALEKGEVKRLGGAAVRTVDVRVVSATHRNLPEAVNAGAFRADLFYRLAGVRVLVPPLRKRREDIPLLVNAFMARTAEEMGLPFEPPAPELLDKLAAQPWPGNVRELRNAVERSLVAPELADMPGPAGTPPAASTADEGDEPLLPYHRARQQAIDRFERDYARRLLAAHPGVSAAARAAEIDRRSLQRLVRRLSE